MTSYQIEVKECPHCDTQFASWEVASCNTFGAEFYTDGFVDGPMYDEGGALLICPVCGKYIWLEDFSPPSPTENFDTFGDRWVPIEEIFAEPSPRPSLTLEDVLNGDLPFGVPVSWKDYEDVLRGECWSNKDQERYVRTRAWWSFNSGYRSRVMEDISLSAEQEANLRALLNLLDDQDPDASISKAEIFRQLGEFDRCLRQLDREFDENYLQVINRIAKLAKDKIRGVARIREA